MNPPSSPPEAAGSGWKIPTIVKVLVGVALVGAALTAAGGYLAYRYFTDSLRARKVYVEDLKTGEVRAVTDVKGCAGATLSPDGTTVLFHRFGDEGAGVLMTASLADGATRVVLDDGAYNYSPAWGPGRDIYYLSRRGGRSHLWRRNLDSGEAARVSEAPVGGKIKLSPDGSKVLVLRDRELFLVPATGEAPEKVVAAEGVFGGVSCFGWAPDSKAFAYVSFLSLVVAEPGGAVLETISLAGLNNMSELFFSPDDTDTIVLRARKADSRSLSPDLYKVSRRAGNWRIWKTGRGLLELSHDISRDGTKLVFTR